MNLGGSVVVLAHGALALVAVRRGRQAAIGGRARARRWAPPDAEGRPAKRSLRIPTRRSAGDGDALADLVDALASTLATGVGVTEALEAAAARSAPTGVGVGLNDVARSMRDGVPATEAFERWAASPGSPAGAGLVAAAFGIASATGGDVAAGLSGVGATLRERQAVAREVRALASQARASAVVIALAPVGFALLTAGLGGTAARFLLGSPAGAACLLAGVGLDAAGWRWMQRITESVR